MLIAIVLDRPLAEAQTLVDRPRQFKKVLNDHKTHSILERTIQGDAKKEASSSSSSKRRQQNRDDDTFQCNFHESYGHQGVPLDGHLLSGKEN